MNLDDMKTNWQDHNDRLADRHFDVLAADVKVRSTRFEAAILRRDWIEAATAIVVLICFGLFLRFGAYPFVMKLGIAIVMLSMVEIIAVMFWTRHRDARPQQDSSLLDFSRAELTRVNRQIGLLRKISWWYSTPVFVGCGVLIFGVLLEVPQMPRLTWAGFLAGFCLCFFWAGNAIHRINQRAVTSELIPLRDQVTDFLTALGQATRNEDNLNDDEIQRM